MTDNNLGFNLTQYKLFRQLQLQYTKLRNEHELLQSQMGILEQNYQQKCQDVLDLKKEIIEEKIKLKNNNLKYKQLYRQLIEHIQTCLNSIKQNDLNISTNTNTNPNTNDKSIFLHLEDVENLQRICAKLTTTINQYIEVIEENRQLCRKVQYFDIQQKGHSLQKQKTEKIVVKQIQRFQSQLQQVNSANAQLQAKINLKDKEKRKVQSELKALKTVCRQLEMKVGQLAREKQQSTRDNPEFALDLMTFQLQTLRTFFSRVAQSTKVSTQMANLLMIIYDDYEELSQVFREKLQIQFDLEQLQQRYKSQKLTPQAEEHLLIETRRQIETFRLQLLKQKQIVRLYLLQLQFRQKQQFIGQHFVEYVKVNEEEMKIRNYSYEVQNRLYRQKKSHIESAEKHTVCNSTARDILAKKINSQKNFTKDHPVEQQDIQSQQQVIAEKKTSVKFKQTNNAQEIMREIIKKDKKNLEKILKETRGTSTQVYINK